MLGKRDSQPKKVPMERRRSQPHYSLASFLALMEDPRAQPWRREGMMKRETAYPGIKTRRLNGRGRDGSGSAGQERKCDCREHLGEKEGELLSSSSSSLLLPLPLLLVLVLLSRSKSFGVLSQPRKKTSDVVYLYDHMKDTVLKLSGADPPTREFPASTSTCRSRRSGLANPCWWGECAAPSSH